MAVPKKLQGIQEGFYLCDSLSAASLSAASLSAASLKSSPLLHEASDRPFAVPWYDPEGSTITSYSPPPPPYIVKALPALPPPAAFRASIPRKNRYRPHNNTWEDEKPKHARKYAPHLGSPHPRTNRLSRLSLTPSAFPIGAPNAADTPDPKAHEKTLASPPDGGTTAWLHVLAGHLVVFNAQGLNMSYGLFQAYYESLLLPSHSPSQIAWIGSLQIFLLFSAGLLASPLVDRGLFRLCFVGGSLLLVASLVVTSFCTRWWQLLLVQGGLTGLGMGLVFSSGVVVLMSYFSRRMGVATGLAAAGGSTGGVVFPLIAKQLIFKIGFPWTMRVIALVSLLTLLPANLIVRQRPGWRGRGRPEMDWAAFRDAPFMLMMAGMFFSFWGVFFGFYYIVSYGQSVLHLTGSSAANLLIFMNVANLPGRFLPALISDACIGPLNTIIPSTFLAAMLIFLWVGASTHTALLIVACFYGFAAAGLQGLYNATIFGFCPEPSKLGIRMAMAFVVIGLACLTGSPIGGALVK
ncbi:MAG: MFS monocarboxylate [Lasallia pustulata]|uniref:MFS monocarboxylate n=1 Tax=Lasallia pustulata TaxID=136370 RepID=A0A5M8PZ36_9LECA|nr:MAG: MFS monocarboxylate [Lasallia pustulata]